MAGNWPTVPLEDLLQPGRSISYGIVQPGHATSNGVPIVRVSDVREGRISTDAPLRVAPEVEAAYSRTRLKGGELLLTLVGTVGESAIAPPSLRGWNTARAVAVIPIRNDVSAYWVKLALDMPAVRERINGRLNTTVQATLNLRDVAQLPILLPSAQDRQGIMALLGALDEKIELNRSLSETLERMARALFKSWFVDFDPIFAKAEGRPTGLPDELAAMFPEGVGEDKLPKGWPLRSVDALVEINPRTALPVGTMSPYVDMAALPTHAARVRSIVERPAGSGSRFQNGDTLVARITPCLENGKTAVVDALPNGAAAWGSTEFIVLRPRIGVPRPWPYLLARDPSFRMHLIASMTGTSGRQRVSPEAVRRWEMATPPQAILAAFGSVVAPLFDRIRAADVESGTLGKLRDTLLPKLLSGELRIADAERQVAAA